MIRVIVLIQAMMCCLCTMKVRKWFKHAL